MRKKPKKILLTTRSGWKGTRRELALVRGFRSRFALSLRALFARYGVKTGEAI